MCEVWCATPAPTVRKGPLLISSSETSPIGRFEFLCSVCELRRLGSGFCLTVASEAGVCGVHLVEIEASAQVDRERLIPRANFRACSYIDRELGLEVPIMVDWERRERTTNRRACPPALCRKGCSAQPD